MMIPSLKSYHHFQFQASQSLWEHYSPKSVVSPKLKRLKSFACNVGVVAVVSRCRPTAIPIGIAPAAKIKFL